MYKLVIVDDEVNIREGLSRVNWNALGIELAGSYENGLEVLRCFEEEAADLLLADIRMPFMSGLELAEKVKKAYPFTKIVILTGYSDFDLVRSSLRSGVCDYLLKPSTTEELTRAFLPLVAMLNDERREAEEEQMLRRKSQLASVLMRIQFLNKLLYMPLSQEEIEEGCTNANIRSDAEAYTVAVIGLDDKIRTDYSIKDWELLLFALDNTLTEIWEREGHGSYFVEADSGSCYILGQGENEKLAEHLASVREHLYRFRGLFKTTMSIALGESASRLADIWISREQADIAQRRTNGDEEIVHYVFEGDSIGEGDESAVKEAVVGTESGPPGDSETSRRIVEAAKSYVRVHFREPISLKQIAQRVHVNSAYLSYLFKEVTGENYLQYLTACRLEEATRLLKDPSLKIYEVSERVGYQNAQHFSIIFKRYNQVTPLEYRNKHVTVNFIEGEANHA
ncbi:hypothetical protein Back11_33820 [Paenibacillus baekrokdamisoli]|uniref:Uncharacterized protein n=1 Tax=Paenibacillus baekrokdamisoli TaxID=1712516 RepID=A0A3G9IT41_9BACL|nr:helix-turn-helix domain-containing protein [Paenibacillus baekrokdamisoli]MBB3073364.1 two-component system response regulator YesN [Paenibacillus baekrokdamisoli]BBH22037.1 hypothetical protein Back11_33820 [Paenibacillus baekrokdamisoli]